MKRKPPYETSDGAGLYEIARIALVTRSRSDPVRRRFIILIEIRGDHEW